MQHRLSRRILVLGAATASLALSGQNRVLGQEADWNWALPIANPEGLPGDGFHVRHGFASENTWYNPGWWHTAEDWYRLGEEETGGALVHAVADGEIVFAGSDYPGRVVIIEHADDLFTMYGHLDFGLEVDSGTVAQGQVLGTVLARTDGRAPSHLHFEARRFLTTPEVNGASPRYDAGCTLDCPPGPGYWPIDAPEHPAAMGWLNSTHVFGARAFPDGIPVGVEVIVATGAAEIAGTWSDPGDGDPTGELSLVAGDRYPLVDILAGDVDSTETSAEATVLWYCIALPDAETPVWVQAAVPSGLDTGSDGRSSSLRFDFLPDVATGA